jgi:hypothetical protein
MSRKCCDSAMYIYIHHGMPNVVRVDTMPSSLADVAARLAAPR